MAYRPVGALSLVAVLLIRRSEFAHRQLEPVLVIGMCAMTFAALTASMAVFTLDGAGVDAQFEERRFGIALIFVFAAAIVPARWSARPSTR